MIPIPQLFLKLELCVLERTNSTESSSTRIPYSHIHFEDYSPFTAERSLPSHFPPLFLLSIRISFASFYNSFFNNFPALEHIWASIRARLQTLNGEAIWIVRLIIWGLLTMYSKTFSVIAFEITENTPKVTPPPKTRKQTKSEGNEKILLEKDVQLAWQEILNKS